MAKVIVLAYGVMGLCWFAVSFALYPWEPPTFKTRLIGSLVQAPVWPLSLMAWAMLKFEPRKR